MNPILYPSACRKYAELSPDIHCQAHLERWLQERGNSLLSYSNWLNFRLTTDSLPLANIDTPDDFSMFDNLNAIG